MKPKSEPRSRPHAATPERLLVTTDLSREAEHALPLAACLAERFHSAIDLLYVVVPPSRLAGLDDVILLQSGDAEVGRAYRALDSVGESRFDGEIHVTTHVRTGKPFQEIMSAAKEFKTDLIVMATHGYTGLKHTLLGSTTERVVRYAPCPVLSVRSKGGKASPRGSSPAIKNVVLPTDFSRQSLKAFRMGAMLARAFDAKITLLHVVENPSPFASAYDPAADPALPWKKAARKKLSSLADTKAFQNLKVDTALRTGTAFAEIVACANKLEHSIIVLATHGFTGLRHLYLGSVAERVLRHSAPPVLVVR